MSGLGFFIYKMFNPFFVNYSGLQYKAKTPKKIY